MHRILLTACMHGSDCTGECPAGFFCEQDTQDPRECERGTYCPPGSAEPRTLPDGAYGTDCRVPVEDEHGALSQCGSATVCPPGHYCAHGGKLSCPPGRYGEVEGLSDAACQGKCPDGYVCTEASVDPEGTTCGEALAQAAEPLPPIAGYCPAGAREPLLVPPGYVGVGDIGLAHSTAICEAGTWCVDGVQSLCPAGRYGDTAEESSEACSGPCLEGYACPAGSTGATAVPCDSPTTYCPAESGSPIDVPAGYYSVPEGNSVRRGIRPCTVDAEGVAANYCRGGLNVAVPDGRVVVVDDGGELAVGITLCPAGSWCVNGTVTACDEPQFCPAGSTTNANACTDPRYVCPTDAQSRREVQDGFRKLLPAAREESPCGSPAFYCVGGVRFSVDVGYMSIGGLADGTTRTAQQPCGDPSTYCVNGEQLDVEDGYVAAPKAGSNADVFSRQVPCGDVGVYCRSGSMYQVDDGYYSVDSEVVAGTRELPWADTAPHSATQVDQRAWCLLRGRPAYPVPAWNLSRCTRRNECAELHEVPGGNVPAGAGSDCQRQVRAMRGAREQQRRRDVLLAGDRLRHGAQ